MRNNFSYKRKYSTRKLRSAKRFNQKIFRKKAERWNRNKQGTKKINMNIEVIRKSVK